MVAIYLLFLALSLFLVLPFGVQTHDEAGVEKIPGQAESAPANFQPLRVLLRAAIVAAVLFGLFYANYINGWITGQDINLFADPPAKQGSA
jgi:predicted secreted protein